MTRKDYVALARAFAKVQPLDSEPHHFDQWADDVRAVADILEADNPRFDRLRFLYAAASTGGTVDAHAVRLLETMPV